MAITNPNTGTLTATGAEDTLATVTTVGAYVLEVDTSNMANGDLTIIRAKTKTLTSSSSTLAFEAHYKHAQADPVKISVPVGAPNEVVFTLEQTAGTNRNYDWSIIRLDT